MSLTHKDPSEVVVITFPFGQTKICNAVMNPVVTVTLLEGTLDPSPAAILLGQPTVFGTDVMQAVHGGVDGAVYSLRCEIDTDNGQHLVMADALPVMVARPVYP